MPKLRTLTVRQLKQILDDYADDVEVVIATPTNNYWGHVTVASLDSEEIQEKKIVYSEYHRKFKIPEEGTSEYEEDGVTVLVLS